MEGEFTVPGKHAIEPAHIRNPLTSKIQHDKKYTWPRCHAPSKNMAALYAWRRFIADWRRHYVVNRSRGSGFEKSSAENDTRTIGIGSRYR
jgi:hypothetical protein